MGYKIDRENMSFKFTQPVMVQSFNNEFEVRNRMPIATGDTVTTLVKAEEGCKVSPERTTYFGLGVGKILHIMRWSRL